MSADRAVPRPSRSSSCSAGRRPSTTSRSCRGPRSPTRCRSLGYPVRQVLIDLDGGWWWLPADHRRDGRPQSTYDDPAALGAEGPLATGAALDRLAGTDPAPVVVDRAARAVRRGRDRPGAARGGRPGLHGLRASRPRRSAWTRRIFKRMCRGIGLPVVDWREVRAARWAADPGAVRTELEAFAAGSPEPAADGQAGRPRQLGRDDPRPRPERARRARSTSPSATTRWPLSRRTSPGARDLEVSVIGNDPAALELYGPGEIVSGHEFYDYAAKYTAGLSETSTRPR